MESELAVHNGRPRSLVRIGGDRILFAALFLLLALQVVLPMPHTIALRVFLIVSNLFLCAYVYYKRRPSLSHLSVLVVPAILYAALTAWIVLGAVFVSIDTARSLAEFNGQWLRAFLLFVIGVSLVTLAPTGSARRLLLAAALAGPIFHIAYLDASGLITLFNTGYLPERIGGLTDGPDNVGFMTNAIVAFLLADAYFVLSPQARGFLPRPLFILFSAMCLLAFHLEAMRNGVAAFVVSVFVLIWIYTGDRRGHFKGTRLALHVLILISVALATMYMSAEADKRWGALDATIPIALDTSTNKAWLDGQKYPLPRLPNGELVNPSNYLRIAWFKEGLKIVAEHPLGVGYDRNAFGHELQRKYHEGSGGSSHSGLLDMFIATGVPGGLLWLALLFSVLRLGLACFRRTKSYSALALFFLVLDFSLRMSVDGTVRDHIFQQFMLLAGLLSALMALDVQESRSDAPIDGAGQKRIA